MSCLLLCGIVTLGDFDSGIMHNVCIAFSHGYCRAMKTKGMVFRYTWVYSKEDTMAHTRRAVVTS